MSKVIAKVACLAILLLYIYNVGAFAQNENNKVKKNTMSGPANVAEAQHIGTYGTQYLFGVAISYADSVTYITNICPVSQIKYDKRTKTTIGAELYTESLKNYLLQQGKTGYLCSTFMCKSMKEAEKKVVALRNKTIKQKQTRLQAIDAFRYEHINTDNIFSNVGQGNDGDF